MVFRSIGVFTRAVYCLALVLLGVLGGSVRDASAQAQDVVIYYHTDAIGSVRAITDANGQELQRFDFLPFGEPMPAPPLTADVKQFAGKERDPETGFNYFGARYYQSLTGRFTSTDPFLDFETALIEPQRWNRYAYALNNPLKFTDPDGRNPLLVGGAIGAGVYAAWTAYQNVQQGRSWYENVGVEASRGFLIGVSLGLAGPALSGAVPSSLTSASLTGTTTSTAVVAQSSGDLGKIVGWGTNQSAEAVAQTLRVTRELSASRVSELVQRGVTREWVQRQLELYQKSLESGGDKLKNAQLIPRIELMKKLLGYFEE